MLIESKIQRFGNVSIRFRLHENRAICYGRKHHTNVFCVYLFVCLSLHIKVSILHWHCIRRVTAITEFQTSKCLYVPDTGFMAHNPNLYDFAHHMSFIAQWLNVPNCILENHGFDSRWAVRIFFRKRFVIYLLICYLFVYLFHKMNFEIYNVLLYIYFS